MKITFIGLGIMGSRMALNLARNNTKLTVYNRTEKDHNLLKQEGVIIERSLAKAVENADIVFSMLSTPEAVEEVFFGNDKVLNRMKANAIWVDCTTVNPSFSIKAFQEATSHNIRFLDAPVAGSKPQAENAELVFFVGGKKETLSEVEQYLNYMGKKVLRIGKIGKGASFKMLVNIMLAESMLIFSEAVLLGKRLGLEKDFLLDLLPNLVVSAPFTKIKAETIKDDNYEVQFPLEWMHKDLHLATLTAYEENQPLYLANLTKEIYADANKLGLGRLDFSAIFKHLEKLK